VSAASSCRVSARVTQSPDGNVTRLGVWRTQSASPVPRGRRALGPNSYIIAQRGVFDQSRALSSDHISVNKSELGKAAQAIARAVNAEYRPINDKIIASLYLSILVDILTDPKGETGYIDSIVKWADSAGVTIASLNYDLLVEDSANRCNVVIDYGLEDWNDKRIVRWNKDRLRLIKLHGSANWTGKHDDIKINEKSGPYGTYGYKPPILIFGGQNRKLTPDGPFLQLRGELEKTLMSSEKIMIVGYSLGDEHLNALLRGWAATRKRGRLVFVDPGNLQLKRISGNLSVFRLGDQGARDAPVEIKVISKGAADGIDEGIALMKERFSRSV